MDLGCGVAADIFSAIDDKLLVTWDGDSMVVDQRAGGPTGIRHRGGQPRGRYALPAPPAQVPLNSMFTVLFRGNSSTLDTSRTAKDDALLTEFALTWVRAQSNRSGSRRDHQRRGTGFRARSGDQRSAPGPSDEVSVHRRLGLASRR